MSIESILSEWCYQLPAGYPTSNADYDVLRNILRETTTLTESQIRRIITRAQHGITEQDDDIEPESSDLNTNIESQIAAIGLPTDVTQQIVATYNSLTATEQQQFNNNFRKHSIQSFVETGWKAFEKFFMVNVGGARGGMGNGEISVLLAVANSKPGGTAQHDIVLPTGEWEVKELKDDKFDPAKLGFIANYTLTTDIQSFYSDLVQPIESIGDPYEQLKHMVNPKSADRLKRLIRIFETRFIDSIDQTNLPKGEWKKSALWNWYEGFKELHAVFFETELDTDVRDTRLTVSTGGNAKSFWISDDDADNIQNNAGSDQPTDIYIGAGIEDENTDAVIWFKRLARNKFIKNPKTFVQELNSIKQNFFSSIAGLIWYAHRNPQPNIAQASDFVIDTVSQGRYRFSRKNIPKNQNYAFIEDQE